MKNESLGRIRNRPQFDNTVTVHVADFPRYPQWPPFHPHECYPEYELEAVGTDPNPVYKAVRDCFMVAGLDRDNFGENAGIL